MRKYILLEDLDEVNLSAEKLDDVIDSFLIEGMINLITLQNGDPAYELTDLGMKVLSHLNSDINSRN